MVLVAVLGLIRPAEFARLARINRPELWIALATTVIGPTAGLLAAVAAGVVSTLVLVLHELNKVRLTPVDAGAPSVLLVVRPSAGLYTANIRAAQRSVTVLDALRELDRQLAGDGTQLWIAALPERATATAERTRWFPQWRTAGRVWPDVHSAVITSNR